MQFCARLEFRPRNGLNYEQPMTPISPKHLAIKAYFDARNAIAAQNVTHEMAVRSAFQALLDATRPRDWTLVPEQKIEGSKRAAGWTVQPEQCRRELPRIPFAPQFWPFVEAGRKLAQLHIEYETVEKHPLKFEWATGKPIAWRVEKMRLSKDKAALVVNDSLTLHGIPPQVFEYRLGNRSALDWVIDQYQVSEDKRSGIRSDPNAYSDNERYIVELVQRVVTVSVETVKIVAGLPELGIT